MSKLVNRIFKHKQSKTLDDLQSNGSSTKQKDSKTSNLPRSKTTQLTVVNGHAQNGHHKPDLISSASGDISSSKEFESIRSPGGTAIINNHPSMGECLSPMEIPAEDALQMIAEEPPHVARSTPKGLPIDTSKWKEQHEMQHCIYEKAVYEKMIENSLEAVEALQKNLDSYITVVRQTPSREMTPVKSGNEEKRKA
jgi:hypothetical protein